MKNDSLLMTVCQPILLFIFYYIVFIIYNMFMGWIHIFCYLLTKTFFLINHLQEKIKEFIFGIKGYQITILIIIIKF